MGYIGYSRSVNSWLAIEDYEIPISMFNRKIIDEFLQLDLNDKYKDELEWDYDEKFLTESDYEMLKKASVALWKKSAKYIGASSWHHTSKFYNETDHYSLFETAMYLLKYLKYIDEAGELLNKLAQEYKELLLDKNSSLYISKDGKIRYTIPTHFFGYCFDKTFNIPSFKDFDEVFYQIENEFILKHQHDFTEDEYLNQIFRQDINGILKSNKKTNSEKGLNT